MHTAALVRQCLESFAEVVNLASNDQFTADLIDDEAGRFRIWAGNVSAHTTGQGSLQHQLRDSPELSTAVTRYLQDLLVVIRNIKPLGFYNNEALSSHMPTSENGHVGIGDSDGNDYDAEDDDLFGRVVFSESADGALEEAREIISCLFRLSMAFRNPARRDHRRYVTSNITADITSIHEPYDIRYVSSVFPNISAELSER